MSSETVDEVYSINECKFKAILKLNVLIHNGYKNIISRICLF